MHAFLARLQELSASHGKDFSEDFSEKENAKILPVSPGPCTELKTLSLPLVCRKELFDDSTMQQIICCGRRRKNGTISVRCEKPLEPIKSPKEKKEAPVVTETKKTIKKSNPKRKRKAKFSNKKRKNKAKGEAAKDENIPSLPVFNLRRSQRGREKKEKLQAIQNSLQELEETTRLLESNSLTKTKKNKDKTTPVKVAALVPVSQVFKPEFIKPSPKEVKAKEAQKRQKEKEAQKQQREDKEKEYRIHATLVDLSKNYTQFGLKSIIVEKCLNESMFVELYSVPSKTVLESDHNLSYEDLVAAVETTFSYYPSLISKILGSENELLPSPAMSDSDRIYEVGHVFCTHSQLFIFTRIQNNLISFVTIIPYQHFYRTNFLKRYWHKKNTISQKFIISLEKLVHPPLCCMFPDSFSILEYLPKKQKTVENEEKKKIQIKQCNTTQKIKNV